MSGTRPLKKRLMLLPLLVGILLPCVVFVVLHLSRQAKSESELVLKDAVVISGQLLPKTHLLELNGNTVSSEILRKGKVVLVFLTTNCQACQKEFKLALNLKYLTK